MLTRLRKLRKRFIMTNMLLVGAVILFVFVSSCIVSYRAARRQVFRALSDALAEEIRREEAPDFDPSFSPPAGQDGGFKQNGVLFQSVYIYTARVDRDGAVLPIGESAESADPVAVEEAVRSILEEPKSEDVLSSGHLIYQRVSYQGEQRVAFCSDRGLRSASNLFFLVMGGGCVVMLVFIYFISRLLAGIAIRPIEEAWVSQKQFIADASHDLKTPLTVILADTSIMREELERGSVSPHWIDGIHEEATHMRNLVEKMLELARTDTMKGSLAFVPTDLAELTEKAILQLEPVAFEKEVELEGRIGRAEHPTDPATFTRLLYILIENAIKYSEGGKVIVRLRTEKQFIRLSVENTGTIAEEDLARIFERFYRADKARGTGGFGLGLSIAKNLADALGGELKAGSADGKTVFTFLLRRQFLAEIADLAGQTRREK